MLFSKAFCRDSYLDFKGFFERMLSYFWRLFEGSLSYCLRRFLRGSCLVLKGFLDGILSYSFTAFLTGSYLMYLLQRQWNTARKPTCADDVVFLPFFPGLGSPLIALAVHVCAPSIFQRGRGLQNSTIFLSWGFKGILSFFKADSRISYPRLHTGSLFLEESPRAAR